MAPTKSVVFVLGASGSIGSATVKSLSEKYAGKVEIRAGVRNPQKADKLKDLKGVTLVQANMADKDNLTTVLAGVSTLYIVVPGAENRVELTVISADAAKKAGVKHIVIVSVSMADLKNTIFGKHFTEIEGKIKGLGVAYTILRLPYFMDNFLGFAATVKSNGQFYLPLSADRSYVVVDTDDVGQAAAAILVDPSRHAGKTYHLASARVTNTEIANVIASLLGKKVSFVQSDAKTTKEVLLGYGLPEWQVDGILELFEETEKGSPLLNPKDIGDIRKITGADPRSLKEYINAYAGVFQ